jgi:hypothetical protein
MNPTTWCDLALTGLQLLLQNALFPAFSLGYE